MDRLPGTKPIIPRVLGLPAALLATVLVAGLLLTACGSTSSTGGAAPGAGSPGAGTPVKGGTMIVAYQSDPQALDPAVDWEGNGWSIEHCLYNTFLTYASGTGTAGTKLVPDIATEVPTVENGGISKDGKTYTFHLRQGVKFAPPVAREVTAEDFKYSFERMMDPDTKPNPPGTGFYMSIVGAQEFNQGKANEIAGFKAVDKYTVEIDLTHADATMLPALSMPFTAVVPKEWVEKWGRQFVRHPLGTGPYMMDHWTSGQELVLVRNPNWHYWRTDGGDQAWVDGFKFLFSVTPTRALLLLKRGQNDVLGSYIASSDYVSVTSDPVWKKQVAEQPAIAIDYLFMNVQMKPFDNLKVRQAVAWAIDREKLIKLISGAGSQLSQVFPAGLPGHVDGSAGDFYGYDPAKAKQLLAEAGYPNGFSTMLYSHNIDPWPKVIVSIQNDLKQIGITAGVKTLNQDTYWTLIGKPKTTPMGLQDWWQDFPDPADFVLPLFSKSNAIENGANPSYWWDDTVEAQLKRSFAMPPGPERLALFQTMQQEIMDQAPGVPLYQPNVNSVFSKRMRGWYLPPIWIFDFLDYWIQP
jgi:ABC-type transport system substrate-binding protein